MWYLLTTLFALLVWSLFVYDMRIVRLREKDSAGPAGDRLYAMVERDQMLNIRFIIPAIFAFNAGCAIAIHTQQEFFLERRGHLILIAFQAIGLLAYLSYVIRAFVQLSPLISATREEWRAKANEFSTASR